MTVNKDSRTTSKLIMVIAAVTAIFSAYMIVSTLITGAQEQNAFDALTVIVEQEKEKKQDTEEEIPNNQTIVGLPAIVRPENETNTEPMILPEYEAIYEQNSDFFGWLRIDDTTVNYPVMHTPEDPQYYLRRAFDKSDAHSGTPFLDGACFEGCGNYIIYGHHMKNGTMLGTLPKYADKKYWEQHKIICFDTLYEHGEYEVIAAFYGKSIPKGEAGFRYYQYTDLTNPVVFEEYITQVKAAAVYDTGIAVEYGDELLTLSTCSYHTTDGRFVVVAKKMSN